jgi:hypothetical protein
MNVMKFDYMWIEHFYVCMLVKIVNCGKICSKYAVIGVKYAALLSGTINMT